MDIDFEKDNFIEINGQLEGGKQFDLDINLKETRRNVIYGIVKDSCGDPVKDAVVKLIEVSKHNKRKPVSHTFTNRDGEFVFGPLCPDRKYAIDIWASKVEHIKICKSFKKEGHCLKGIDIDCDDFCGDGKYDEIENN